MFYILIVAKASGLCKFVKSHGCLQFKANAFVLCELYLNEVNVLSNLRDVGS